MQDKYKAAYEEKYATAEDPPPFDGLLWKEILESRSMYMYPHKLALGGLPSNFYDSSSSASNAYSTATSASMSAPAQGTSTTNDEMKGYIDSKFDSLSQQFQALTQTLLQGFKER